MHASPTLCDAVAVSAVFFVVSVDFVVPTVFVVVESEDAGFSWSNVHASTGGVLLVTRGGTIVDTVAGVPSTTVRRLASCSDMPPSRMNLGKQSTASSASSHSSGFLTAVPPCVLTCSRLRSVLLRSGAERLRIKHAMS
jgi:hypothetical protein